MKKLKLVVFKTISMPTNGFLPAKIFGAFIIALIALNVVIVMADTFSDLSAQYGDLFIIIDYFTAVIFTVEYLLRIWTADLLYPDARRPRLKYLLSPSAIVDLIAILPLFIPAVAHVNLRVLRTIRLVRIFKLNRYSYAFATIVKVLKLKSRQLISSIISILILIFISSVLMYGFEHTAQPEVFSNAFSGIWWSVVTITTVGYGDIYPVTIAGKVCGAVIALLDVGFIAVPAGILSAGFVEQTERDEGVFSKTKESVPAQLRILFELKKENALTDEEFESAKADLLNKLK